MGFRIEITWSRWSGLAHPIRRFKRWRSSRRWTDIEATYRSKRAAQERRLMQQADAEAALADLEFAERKTPTKR